METANIIIIIIIMIILCCSMIASSMSMAFAEKFPIIGPQIGQYEPYLFSGLGFSILISSFILILLILFPLLKLLY